MAAGRIPLDGYQPILDGNANPDSGGQATFYEAGTSALATIYADFDLTTPLTNPVVANSSGQLPAIFADPSLLFDVKISRSSGAQVAYLLAIRSIGAPGAPSDAQVEAAVGDVLPPLIADKADTDLANVNPAEGRVALEAVGRTGGEDEAMTGTLVGVGNYVPAGMSFANSFEGNGGAEAQFVSITRMTTTQALQGNIAQTFFVQNYHAPPQPNNYCVAVFGGIQTQAGGGDGFTFNGVHFMEPGTTTAFRNATNHFVFEGDLGNNSGVAYGTQLSIYTIPQIVAKLAAEPLWGNTNPTGEVATFKSIVEGNAQITAHYLAYTVGGGSVGRAYSAAGQVNITAYQDDSSAPTVLLATGAKTNGIDLSRTTGMSGAVLAPFNSYVGFLKEAGDGFAKIKLITGNDLVVGTDAVTVSVDAPLRPVLDNAAALGDASHRWSSVWAANGTIQTSDQRLKTDIQPMPDVWELVKAIEPITFRWKEGGQEEYFEDELQPAQVIDTISVPFEEIDPLTGRLTSGFREEQHPRTDEILVSNADGSPAYVDLTRKSVMVAYKNNPQSKREKVKYRLSEAYKDSISEEEVAILLNGGTIQRRRTATVPVMEMRMAPVRKVRTVPGARTHGGFLYQQMKATFDAFFLNADGTRRDFAGLVLGEDGFGALRPDEWVPVLTEMVRLMAARIEALEAA